MEKKVSCGWFHFSLQIKRIQQESSLVAPLVVPGSVVPDKPPPPYTPPASNTSTSSHSKPPRPAQPKPTQKYVPGSKDEIFKIATVMVRDIYDAKEKRREFKENVIIDHAKSVVTDLPEKGHTSFDKFIKFLFDLVSETVADVFKWELETQNPPWMPQKSLATEKRKLPKSEAQLLERVKREISIYFGYEKRSQKENLIVRWSQKRRDRVDQILVRELHAEEQSWTDYHKDETMVKDQLTDTMVKILLDDTTKELIKVLKK